MRSSSAARRTVWEAQNPRTHHEEFTRKGSGRLVIATTHMYARYVLRPVIKDFIARPSAVQAGAAADRAVDDPGVDRCPAKPTWASSASRLRVHDELLFLEGETLQRSVIVPEAASAVAGETTDA